MPSAALIAEAVKLRTGKRWYWLYEIELQTNTTESRWLLLTSHDQAVTFDGETYHPWPIRHGDIDSGNPGDLADLQVVVGNAGGKAAEYLQQYGGLRGRRVVIRLAQEDLLTAANSYSNAFEVISSEAQVEGVALQLGHLPLHRLKVPSGRYNRWRCRFRFRGARCGWVTTQAGDSTACDLTLDGANGCAAHANEERFGGFPSMPGAR